MHVLGLAPHTIFMVLTTALIAIAGVAYAIRLERQGQRREAQVAGELSLGQMRQVLGEGRLGAPREFWLTMESALLDYRPDDSREEAERQELLETVRVRLT